MRAAGLFGLNTGPETVSGLALTFQTQRGCFDGASKKTEASEFLGPGAPNLTLRSLEFRVIT
jgi:hypothetical protein